MADNQLEDRDGDDAGDGHHHHHHGENSALSDTALRVKSLESLLVEKGYIKREALDIIVDTYENHVGPRNGAKVVAKAWADPEYLDFLRRDATEAIRSLGFEGRQTEHMKAVENTPDEHNMVVCTLCSCYPWHVLGLPPVWYKSPPYRSRSVIDPRGVLADFGVTLSDNVDIRVWDSTAELRYIVIPMRPKGTDGWTVEALEDLVTRDSMIGTGLPLAPGETAKGSTI
ncbi:MAG: nitrile hydratase subunit alpha [Pseudomonadota bacterium]